jgi:hypothetical protein
MPRCVREDLRQSREVLVGEPRDPVGMNDPVVVGQLLRWVRDDVEAATSDKFFGGRPDGLRGVVQARRPGKRSPHLGCGLPGRGALEDRNARRIQSRLGRLETQVLDRAAPNSVDVSCFPPAIAIDSTAASGHERYS